MTIQSRFLADTDLPLCRLEVKHHFDALTSKEKAYAHHLSKASWYGARILAATISPESPLLLDLFQILFTIECQKTMADLQGLKLQSGLNDQSWTWFLEYAAQVLNNLGNYKSFGDTKFIPRVPVDDFQKVVEASTSIKKTEALKIFQKIKAVIYSLDPETSCLIGYPGEGHVSGYYSSNISKKDVDWVQSALDERGLSALNTRLLKSSHGYQVLIASADPENTLVETFQLDDTTQVEVIKGDFSREMALIASHIESALPFVANENQKAMLEAYHESFLTGSIEAHKNSQKAWIKDIGPVVETNIGFIETYRDPAGVRAEWEGFVAVVNKEMTKKFGALVNAAENFIPRLPWGRDFEKDKFSKPDFTSLEVLTFATSGSPPAGINIPNYDDIRQTLGFKNVSLGNVLSAKAAKEKTTFIQPHDLAVYDKYRGEAFEIQVGIHELLGHGSGKLLAEEKPGIFNFDKTSPPLSPLTGKPITTWYKPGETWGSIFKSCAASYEECRAELVAMFLCVDREILTIFGHPDAAVQDDLIYICYLNMARAGLLALEVYDPKTKKWGQAHMQARFAILQSLIESGCVQVNLEGESLTINLDRSKILTHGLPAMSTFLKTLQVYKATADAANGVAFYEKVTSVNDVWATTYRDIVLKEKQPRKVFVQGNTVKNGDAFVLQEYDLTLEGLIQSFVERDL